MVMSSEMARSAAAATKPIELADILIRHAGAFFDRIRSPLRYLKVAQRIMASMALRLFVMRPAKSQVSADSPASGRPLG